MFNGEGGIRTRGTSLTPYNGLANRRSCENGDSQPPCNNKTCNETQKADDSVLAQRLAHLVEKYPDFAPVATAWPDLPEAVRAGILAMVQASNPDNNSEKQLIQKTINSED